MLLNATFFLFLRRWSDRCGQQCSTYRASQQFVVSGLAACSTFSNSRSACRVKEAANTEKPTGAYGYLRNYSKSHCPLHFFPGLLTQFGVPQRYIYLKLPRLFASQG